MKCRVYRKLCLKKYELPVKTVMVLFKEHGKAKDFYRDDEISFHFQLVKLYELEAGPLFRENREGATHGAVSLYRVHGTYVGKILVLMSCQNSIVL